MKDLLRELNLEDLNAVAGGRSMTEKECSTAKELYIKADAIFSKMKSEGRKDEVAAFMEKLLRAHSEWVDAIKAAPAGSPDILFSDYFSFEGLEE